MRNIIIFNTLFLFLFLSSTNIYSQKHDYTWLFGYNGFEDNTPEDSIFGVTILDFNAGFSPSVSYDGYFDIDLFECNVSMSDKYGDFIFAFNGFSVVDKSHEIMQYGDSLSNDYEAGFGYILNQGALSLPWPEQPNLYLLLQKDKGWIDFPGWYTEVLGLYYSVIDMEGNNGLGSLIERETPFILDTLQSGQMTATRHANGRDWWIVINESHSNRFYSLLFDPSGIRIIHNQAVGETVQQGLGQGVFSPDGSKFAMFNSINNEVGDFIDIYDFNRCTGELSHHIPINYIEPSFGAGVAFSPNSRFLYNANSFNLYQYDLWATDIENSRKTVAQYDGFSGPFPTKFFLMQLAPNGKIYINSTNGVNYLHTIHFPNQLDTLCQVGQHDVKLPTFNAASMPNHPNYRLGPIDGSACDTLGINNEPVAGFRTAQDSIDYFHIQFTDLSYYAPDTWSWDFGDGEMSDEQSPSHIFTTNGAYEVCLTVSNENSTDTYCETFVIGVVATNTVRPTIEAFIYPNPANDYFIFKYATFETGQVVLFNMMGQRIAEKEMKIGVNRQLYWNTTDLPVGVYFLKVYVAGATVYEEKIVHFSYN